MSTQKQETAQWHMNPVELQLRQKLAEREQEGNLRMLSTKRAEADFFSNDYLGFVTTGLLQEKMRAHEGVPATGSTGSRLLSGNSKEAEDLEDVIAQFHGAEAALIFNSGYDANTGLLPSIANRHTVFLYDELCHASIIDGIKSARCEKKYKFKHNDVDELEEKLKRVDKNEQAIVVAESVYSMDGDIAPLNEIALLAKQYNAAVIVDEAHATGVIGKKGKGVVCESGLQDMIFARVHTFGKALGCHGAAVVGNKLLKDYLVNFARPFIYSTALPMHAIKAIGCAYQHLSSDSFSNEDLHKQIKYFRQKIKDSAIEGWKDSVAPIQALVVGTNERTKMLAQQIQNMGLQVNPILSPTVPLGKERLRICLHSFNTEEQIDDLMSVINANA